MIESSRKDEGARRGGASGPLFARLRIPLLLVLLAGTAALHLPAIHDGHDWGGDFALYLRHAENIAAGRAYGETGYVRTPRMDHLSPSWYPPGFPLLLAPVRLAAGRNMIAFKVEGILFLLGALTLLYFWARREIGDGGALLAAAFFGWNPAVIEASDRVLSDIPFLFFVLLSLLLFRRVWREGRLRPGGALLAAALILFTTIVRPVGALLLLPFLGEGLRRGGLRAAAPWAVAAATAGGTLLGRILLPGVAYAGLMEATRESIDGNLEYYRLLTERFLPEIPFHPDARYYLFLLLAALGAAGIAEFLRRGRWPVFLFVLANVVVVVLFPYQQGHRYLFPVYPFLLVWMILGARRAGGVLPRRARRTAAALGAALLLLCAAQGIVVSGVIGREAPDGPEAPEAAAFLRWVRAAAPEEALFSFWKPRVLAYYTGRRAAALPRFEGPEEMRAWAREREVTHVAFDRAWPKASANLDDAAAAGELYRGAYDDGRFAVFEIREKGERKAAGSDTLRGGRAPEERP